MLEGLERELDHHHIVYDKKIVAKAFEFAQKAHEGQFRVSGEPFIIHPVEVAKILASMSLDEKTILAALLHDTVEDTDVTADQVGEEFGFEVKKLVVGVTKLTKLDFSSEHALEVVSDREQIEIENFRKFFLAVAEDLRVVLIKLADRLHNLKTLSAMPPESQIRTAKETLEIYAPLSDRLGMGQLKVELEDLAFRYYMPEEYAKVTMAVKEKMDDRYGYIKTFKNKLGKLLYKEGLNSILIEGRPKHFYSIYKKLKKSDGDIEKIYDLMAIRIIVEAVSDCYRALGIIHQQYKPLIYRIKDYIAVPKPNGYQSLHTTVFGENGRITEIQIRTPQMHEEAEMGIAAHWHYNQNKAKLFAKKEKGEAAVASVKEISWVKQLIELQKNSTSKEFIESLKIDFFKDRIFVFSPKGNIFNLPEGATAVDFAYHVHTEVGNKCIGAKVNGRIVNLNKRLENRDIVEILIATKAKPSRDWLSFVKTSQAKQNIRSWFRKQTRESNLKSGEEILASEFKANNIPFEDLNKRRIYESFNARNLEDLLVLVGEGQITNEQILRRMIVPEVKKTKTKPVKGATTVIRGAEGMRYRLANCCQPQVGDQIIGYITQGQGISIHRASCKNVITKDPKRLVSVSWENGEKVHHCPITVLAKNRVGLLRDITSVLADKNVTILHVRSRQDKDLSSIDMNLELEDLGILPSILRNIKGINDVCEVKKTR